MNKELFARLGNPQTGQNFIHVAGTNGKGSTCAMLAEILKCAGYKVGLYTSPHLDHYEERIKINGEEISTADWNRLKAVVEEQAESLETVEFDIMTAMAFLYFKEQACDLVVLEVGLGGRLDATNVIDKPLVSAIASIGLEHTEILGDTIEKIAFEKSGIIKAGCPVVVQYQGEDSINVFKAKAEEVGAKLYITEPSKETLHSISLDAQVISYKNHKGLVLPLLGSYQYKNLALVLDTLDVIGQGDGSPVHIHETGEPSPCSFPVTEDAIKKGLSNVRWPGRFEVLRKSPLVILDGAHNPNGAEELAECIKAYLPRKKVHFVMGVLADKNYRDMLKFIAPLASRFTVVTPKSARALDAESLKEIIEKDYKVSAYAAESIKEGVEKATLHQDFKEAVIIFGSLYQVSEVRSMF